jgi:hypothetical protein
MSRRASGVEGANSFLEQRGDVVRAPRAPAVLDRGWREADLTKFPERITYPRAALPPYSGSFSGHELSPSSTQMIF